jgi:hypothetical protein
MESKFSSKPVAHIIFSSPLDVFLAVSNDFRRFPIASISIADERINWLRSDGGWEFVDLSGSIHKEKVISSFLSETGLLLASFDNLSSEINSHDGNDAKLQYPTFYSLIDGEAYLLDLNQPSLDEQPDGESSPAPKEKP